MVGSGIMGERLSGGNVVLAFLANTLVTGATLVALILTFGPISGAHFNPAVTLADASQHGLPWRAVAGYLAAQVVGHLRAVSVMSGWRSQRRQCDCYTRDHGNAIANGRAD